LPSFVNLISSKSFEIFFHVILLNN
jgi:hypothetical protein